MVEGRQWKGNEIILDAGCGTGRVTKILSKKVQKGGGMVYAVDSDSNMVDQVRKNLSVFKNVIVIHSDLTSV